MTTMFAFLFVLGVLVFVHELGHFLVARWHGVRVITFSLGFGPKLVKMTRGGTEYCISVVPLGGYVKLAGETVEDAQTGAPEEFLSKSKWVRFQVYVAGPVMNILLAVVVGAIVLSRGADVPMSRNALPVIGAVAAGSPAEAAGLRVGDLVLSVDGHSVATWDDLEMRVLPRAGRELAIAITRGDERLTVKVAPEAVGSFEMGRLGVDPVMRQQIDRVISGTPAADFGLKARDVLIGINQEKLSTADQFRERIRASANVPLVLNIVRDGASMDVTIVPQGPAGEGTIGFYFMPEGEVRRIDPTLIEAVRLSVEQNWQNTILIGQTLAGLLTRETPVRQLMGPVGIAQLSGSAAEIGWVALLNLMAMISLNLGLLNLMPVPVLDGGHIAILAVEGLSRRDLSVRVKERILVAGAALMVLLMVTVIYNDIARLLR